mmetsp:Transcript_5236/g.5999  ORF Transcript_5236/g.5999 Transcript_5236/m.5999 type:complete len:113 (-) Transcript_5236:17-355(-)
MSYNYFKVLLKVFTPKVDQANKIIGEFRKGSQQAHAVLREFKSDVQQTAPEINKLVDGFTEDIKDPEEETKKKDKNQILSGSSLVHKSMIERKYLIDRKLRKKNNDDQFYKL